MSVEVLREAVARIIDPNGFNGRCAPGTESYWRGQALTKADKILALIKEVRRDG